MKKQIGYFTLLTCLLAVSTTAFAGPHEMPKIKNSDALEKMKQLVGTWDGTGAEMSDKKVEVNYKLSSGGSSVVETLFPGTEQEMTTVYYDEAGKLSMTHYCALGNHPVMHLQKSTANELFFETDAKDPLHGQPHMNSLDITFAGPNSVEQKWTSVEPGKEGHSTVLKLERKA